MLTTNSSPLYHNLHSFPTRRASDLKQLNFVGVEIRDYVNFLAGLPVPMREQVQHRFVGPFALVHVVRILRKTDRKSTRLNSSHLVISYAVFCLKKKT